VNAQGGDHIGLGNNRQGSLGTISEAAYCSGDQVYIQRRIYEPTWPEKTAVVFLSQKETIYE
jgi:hypothetical protein